MDKQKEMIEMCKALRLPSIRSLLEQEALFEQHTSPADFCQYRLKIPQKYRNKIPHFSVLTV